MEKFVSLTFNGLANGAVLALGALGFVLIYKATEVVNFAQGQLLLIGAFMVYTAHVTWGLPWPVAILVAMITGALLGLVIERLVLRPLVGEASLSVIMVTIGLASALFAIGLLVWKTDPRPQPDFMPTGKWHVLGATLNHDRVLAILVAAVLLTGVGLFYRYSKQGIAMRAVADDQQAAMVQGISVNRIFALSWALSGVSAVVAGLLLASINGQYNLLDIQAFGIYVFPVVILGGLDSLLGAAVGGTIVGALYAYTGGYISSDLQEVIPFVVLVLILLIKPYGLFGEVRIERV